MEVSTAAEPSATKATPTTAAHTEELMQPPLPAAAAPTTAALPATGPESKASGAEEKERPSFIDLVFDAILLEESTLHRSRSAPVVRGINKPILVPLYYTLLARAFEIAQTVCHAYHEVHPKHGVSQLAEVELEEAGLESVDRVKAYVKRIGGCNGYFLDGGEGCRAGSVDQDARSGHLDGDEGDQQQEQDTDSGAQAQGQDQPSQLQDQDEDTIVFFKAGIVFPSGRLSDSDSYSIPALNEVQIKGFNDRYGQVNPEYQDMVARVLFRLRKDYWNRTITTSDLDRMEPELLMPYGSRYAQRRRESQARKLAEKAMGSSDAVLSHAAAQHLGALSERLKGLQIVEAAGGKDRKPTFGLQGLFDLPLVVPAEGAFETVGDGIMELYRRLVPSQEYMNKRSKLVQKLQGILNAGFPGQGLRLEVFGSYASGLGSESSDADLCITTEHFQYTASYNNVRAVANVLRRGGMIKIQPITNARVPIVKFVDPTTRTNCDVNTNHVLGIHNSELIRCYTMIDDRVRPFLYSLKALVKKHGINDSSQAWLSSYAYVMMAIGFLQAQEPPVLPALQMQPESQMTELYVQMNHEGRGGKDVINCTFDRDPGRYKNFGAANTKSVGQLLIEFFEFYSRFYDYQTMEVNVRVGGGVRAREELTKARKNGNPNVKSPQRGRGEKKLIVMDPFILDRNVAGSCSGRHLVRVWSIFESLYLTLSRGDFKDAFETISGYDDEEIEHGGPHSRGGRKGGLAPAQERMIATKQTRTQAKTMAVRPRTPVQLQAPVQPKAQTTVIPAQVQVHGQGKAVSGSGATETHRSREKKTERKLERKESRREQRESHKASRDHLIGSSLSSRNIPGSPSATLAPGGVTQQLVQEPAVVQAVASSSATAVTSVNSTGEKNGAVGFGAGEGEGGGGVVDEDDDDNDSQQGGPDGESRSRKRRQRRSIAKTVNSAATASTGVTVTAASGSVAPVFAPTGPPLGGTTREGAVAAAVFATAVARATNSANVKQTTTAPSQSQQPVTVGPGSNKRNSYNDITTPNSSGPSTSSNGVNQNASTTRQQPLGGDQFAQQLQQQHMRSQQLLLQQQAQKKQQKQQKQLNKQLNRQMNKQQQQQNQQQEMPQQGQQQQQLNPQFPVLAKTHKLLIGKTKEGGNGNPIGGGGAGGRKNRDVANGSNPVSGNNGPAAAAASGATSTSGGSKRNSRVQSKPKPQPQPQTTGPKAATSATHSVATVAHEQ